METYEPNFYQELQVSSIGSAQAVVPKVVELLAPRTVIDVGCGTGGWLAEFLAAGIDTALGLDGEWVNEDLLQIPPDCFRRHDLCTAFPDLGQFDLAVSLEVAEHLPPSAAPHFVQSLVNLAPVILFSAAAPGQGGYKHLNEQWPKYWGGLFAKEGYHVVDCLRPMFWQDARVEYWYVQNMMFYVRGSVEQYPPLQKARQQHSFGGCALIHPTFYEIKVSHLQKPGIVQSTANLGKALTRSFKYRLPRGK